MSSVPFPFVNFTAGIRKPALIPYNYFSPGDSVNWIQSIPYPTSFLQTPLLGTINGVNRVFTIGGIFAVIIAVMRNGIVLDPAKAYTSTGVGGATITFTDSSPYIPQVGDDIQAIVG
jgi:hypothetical protein